MTRFLYIALSVALVTGSLFAQLPQSPKPGGAAEEPTAPSSGVAASSTNPAQPTGPAGTPAATAPASQQSGAATSAASTQTNTAQPNAAQPSTSTSQPRKIAPGSVIPVQLTKTVDAKKAKQGDPVVAKVTQDLKTDSGTVIVGKDTRIIGHVTEAQPRNKDQKESQLAIAFDRAESKSGDQMQMPMSIQAIIAPPNRNPGYTGTQAPQDGPQQSPMAGSSPVPSAGGRTAASGSAPATGPSELPAGGTAPTEATTQAAAQAPITGNTQGVVGIPDLKLQAGQNATQGSVVTNDKNNVKLEDGTFLLLKVNP